MLKRISNAFCALAIGVAGAASAESSLPFDIGGPYSLTDQHGHTRTEADPFGHIQLVFFGYANCLNICSAALPLMAEVTREVGSDGIGVTPVLITIDPVQDTVHTLDAPLKALHPDFIGLTGTPEELSVAYRAFNVEFEPLFEDPEYGWVYSHTGFIHLMDADGKMLTLLPPILDVDQMAAIVRKYAGRSG